MPDYNLGRAHGTIRVDYDGRGVRQADDDLNKLGDTSEETGRRTAESAHRSEADYDSLAAAARRLQQEVVRAAAAEVAARARATAAHEHLVQVQNDSSASIRDLAEAQRQLTTETKRYEDATMRAQNATRALANVRNQLASTRKIDLTPDVDTSAFDDITRHLKSIAGNTKTSSGVLNTFRSRIFLMIAAAALASPTIAGLGVALVSLAGLAGVAAGALAGVAAVISTLTTAFSGIGEAFKAAGAAAAGGGASAAQAASQHRAAARQIQQAIRGVRDAEENLTDTRRESARSAVQAAAQIVQAERQLRDAQIDAIRAQESLNRARRDAARQLEDLRSALTGGALDERQAILDVQRAEEELAQARRDPRSTKRDLDQAILNLEKQQLALEDTRRQNQRLGADQAEAASKGVEGSERVVDAQQDVLRAQEAVGDSAVAVAEAVVDAAQQQIDAQRSIRNATESLADAQEDLREAYLSAAEAGAAGGVAVADAMAKISPEAGQLVKAILAQSDAWKRVKFAVQDALFAGLAEEVAPLADKWLPLIEKGMVGIASELHGLILDLINFFHQGSTAAAVATIFENTRLAVRKVIPAVVDLLQIFLDLAAVGSSFLPKLAEGFSRWASNLAEVSRQSREAGTMQTWMQDAMTAAHLLFQLLGNIAGIISVIFHGLNAEGGDVLSNLVALTQRLEDFLKTAEGQDILHSLGQVLSSLAHLIGDVLLGAFIAFGPAFVTLAPLIARFAEILGGEILTTAKILAPILKIIAEVFAFMGPVLVPLIASMFFLTKAVKLAAAAWKLLNLVMKGNIFIAIASAILALAVLIIENWDAISLFLKTKWETIRQDAVTAWEHVKSAIIDPIVKVVQWLQQTWTDFNLWIFNLWNSFLDMVHNIWDRVKSAVIDPVRDAIGSVLNFFRELPGNILSFLRDLPGKMFDVGMDIIRGMLNGLKNLGGKIIQFFKDLIGDAVDSVKRMLGIGSPSKLFAELGEFTWQGYIVGISDMEDPVVKRMVEIATTAANAATPASVIPQAAVLASSIVPKAPAAADASDARTIVVQTLTLNVTGNLDPTNPVTWRKTIKRIRDDIEGVDRSEKP